jgi:uncharacterized membrane protein
MTAFDAGIFDNVLWRLGNGYSDVTAITGSHHFSDHMSPLMLMAVPVYAVVPQLGLPMLIFAQAISVSLVGLAAWLLADHLDLDERSRWAVVLVTLVGAGSYNAALIDVHEVGLALGPLALTVVLAIRETRLSVYWLWPLLAALARMDLAISVLIIGLLLRRNRPRHAQIAVWIGAGLATLMAAWLVVNPWNGTSFAFHFAHLDIDSAVQLPGAILTNPAAALKPLLDPTMWGTIVIWLVGFMAIVPLRAARWIIPALPTVAIPVLGSWQQADKAHLHYWHALVPMLAIAMVFGLAESPRVRERVVVIAALSVAVTWIFMPIFKPSFGDDLTDERAVVGYLQERPDASVAALPNLVPHVAHRPTVMQLPAPFACPTVPIASFDGPNAPPDLVTVTTGLMESPPTEAVATVVSILHQYYEPRTVYGDIEIWARIGPVPEEAYDIACRAGSSENS